MDYRDMKVLPDHKPDGTRPMGEATPGFWWTEEDRDRSRRAASLPRAASSRCSSRRASS